jgi:hypothetical protein
VAKDKQSVYLKLETRIAADERGGIMHRWNYGRELLKAKAGRKQLPHGMITDLIADALRSGFKISEQEIQRRIRLATVYDTETKVRQALTDFGSWSAIINVGFPSVEIDESDDQVDAIEEVGLATDAATGDEQDPLFEIPGFKPVLKINGRKVDLTDLTVRQAVDYRDMCRDMHANFGRTVAQVETSVDRMVTGAEGDLDANAVEAWKRAGGES